MNLNLFFNQCSVEALSKTESVVLQKCMALQQELSALHIVIVPWHKPESHVSCGVLSALKARPDKKPRVTVTTEQDVAALLPVLLKYEINYVFASYCTEQAQQQFAGSGISLKPFPLVSTVGPATDAVQQIWNCINAGAAQTICNVLQNRQQNNLVLPGISQLWQQLIAGKNVTAIAAQLKLLYGDQSLLYDLIELNLQQKSETQGDLAFLLLVLRQLNQQEVKDTALIRLAKLSLSKMQRIDPNLVGEMLNSDELVQRFCSQHLPAGHVAFLPHQI